MRFLTKSNGFRYMLAFSKKDAPQLALPRILLETPQISTPQILPRPHKFRGNFDTCFLVQPASRALQGSPVALPVPLQRRAHLRSPQGTGVRVPSRELLVVSRECLCTECCVVVSVCCLLTNYVIDDPLTLEFSRRALKFREISSRLTTAQISK